MCFMLYFVRLEYVYQINLQKLRHVARNFIYKPWHSQFLNIDHWWYFHYSSVTMAENNHVITVVLVALICRLTTFTSKAYLSTYKISSICVSLTELINTNYKIVFQNSDNLATNLREIKQAIRMSWPYDYSV